METARPASLASSETVRVTNPGGSSPFVFTCDHASNFLPAEFGTLGLPAKDLTCHIAWDPGALPVASRMAAALDATLVETRVSRLVIDCNRPLDAPDLVPSVSETTAIPGNAGLSDKQRAARVDLSWQPFHDAVGHVIYKRLARGQETRLVSVHSFTPVYKGKSRPWHIGIIHDEDRRLASPLIAALQRLAGITVGVNEPYSPADRVYFTLERHARSRGLPCAMIEIRNDEISGEAGQRKWADLLTGIFLDLEPDEASGSRPSAVGKSVQSAS
ncbi:N-formylglutamate amidohydrolase [Mesorhizobium metallidurans STM 2683]|uniref:N-formylglutamate amidohydrolase n=1 Tax=Mesorhizobium metallidurans STM 2683 TaxID=1297569 RepID=M5EMB9_9HYPH|nr:N-formylglutamate amidohydrolase [Mesorhizobium metallidurans]CCV05457.1 N-formylglutamate amidohydrolase [Mesorhizobium metallidurans STM 2683]